MVSRNKPVLMDVLKMLYEGGFSKFKLRDMTPFSRVYAFDGHILMVSEYGGFTFEYNVRNVIDYALRVDNTHGYVTLRMVDDAGEHMEMIEFHYFVDKMYTEEEYFQLSLVKELTLSYTEHLELLKYVRMVKLAHPNIYNGKSWPSL